jgi:hypothetical protein
MISRRVHANSYFCLKLESGRCFAVMILSSVLRRGEGGEERGGEKGGEEGEASYPRKISEGFDLKITAKQVKHHTSLFKIR